MSSKRIAILWLRNMLVASGIMLGVIAFGFGVIFLNTYFGTAMFSLLICAILTVAWTGFMCYKIARDQYEQEQRRSKRLMDTLKKEHI